MYSLANLFLLLLNNKKFNLDLINIHNKRISIDYDLEYYDIKLNPDFIVLTNKYNKLTSIIRYNNQINKYTFINNIIFFDTCTFSNKKKISYNYSDIFKIDNF